MTYVGVLEAKNNLSKLIKTLEQGQEERVVITRNNRPVAQITLVDDESTPRIGVARGESLYREGWDSAEVNEEVAAMFAGSL